MGVLDGLLAETSRTFALTIPLLPSPVREQATAAYLLLRIADTLEDADAWPSARRIEALQRFAALLEHGHRGDAAARFAETLDRDPPTAHAGYRRLLREAAAVFEGLAGLAPEARRLVVAHVARTVAGMQAMLGRGAGGVQLRDLEDLRAYCYAVAGIVGELLTELFVLHAPGLAACAPALRARAPAFGEGLQLTNILKDEGDDARLGRRFIPAAVRRADLLALARGDLQQARAYVRTLHGAGAPRGIWTFTALPVRLAVETLAVLEPRGGSPAAKLARSRVARIVAELGAASAPASFLEEPSGLAPVERG